MRCGFCWPELPPLVLVWHDNVNEALFDENRERSVHLYLGRVVLPWKSFRDVGASLRHTRLSKDGNWLCGLEFDPTIQARRRQIQARLLINPTRVD